MDAEEKNHIPREQLLRWLDSESMQLQLGHPGQESAHLVKLPKTEGVDYIYGLPGSIQLRYGLYFCGVYFHSPKTLRLADSILQKIADGLTPEECADPGELARMLTDQVNTAVETMIGDDRTRLDVKEVTSPELRLELERYLKSGAHEDAVHSFLSRSKPDGRFHSGYEARHWKDDTLLAYLSSPERYVSAEAEQYIQSHKEKILADFIKSDAMLAEYARIMEDPGNDLHRIRSVTEAVQDCGASVVTVTVQDQQSAMTLQLPADSLAGCRDHVDWAVISAEDRWRFWEAFGLRTLKIADISQIESGKTVLYRAPVEQTQDASSDHTMGGMSL